MEWIKNDGGRTQCGYKGEAGDCVTRAISIATEKPYQEIYDMINNFAKQEKLLKSKRFKRSSARDGVFRETIDKVMFSMGWKWVPTMFVGSGCKVHLKSEELPKGRLVVNVSRHTVAVVDGVVHDTGDPTRDGTRCVYGYYVKEVTNEK